MLGLVTKALLTLPSFFLLLQGPVKNPWNPFTLLFRQGDHALYIHEHTGTVFSQKPKKRFEIFVPEHLVENDEDQRMLPTKSAPVGDYHKCTAPYRHHLRDPFQISPGVVRNPVALTD